MFFGRLLGGLSGFSGGWVFFGRLLGGLSGFLGVGVVFRVFSFEVWVVYDAFQNF